MATARKPADADKSPRDILIACSKTDLGDTAIRLGLDCDPGLKKSALADAILARLEEAPFLLASCLGPEVVDTLLEQRRLTNQTRSKTWTCPLWMANDDELLAFALEELGFFGMARRTRSGWILDPALIGWFRLNKDQRALLEAEEELHRRMAVLLPVYGFLTLPDLVRLFTAFSGESLEGDSADMEEILLGIWCRREGIYGVMTDPEKQEGEDGAVMVRDPGVSHPVELLALQRQMKATGQDYRVWTHDELATVGGTDTAVTMAAIHQLEALVRELHPDPDDLGDAVEDAVYWLHEGDRSEALIALEAAFLVEGDDVLTPSQRWILSRVLDKIPLPQLMGRTVDEVNRFTVAEGLRIRPDDPCPCGSGKRYRKCHGRLH